MEVDDEDGAIVISSDEEEETIDAGTSTQSDDDDLIIIDSLGKLPTSNNNLGMVPITQEMPGMEPTPAPMAANPFSMGLNTIGMMPASQGITFDIKMPFGIKRKQGVDTSQPLVKISKMAESESCDNESGLEDDDIIIL